MTIKIPVLRWLLKFIKGLALQKLLYNYYLLSIKIGTSVNAPIIIYADYHRP